MEGEKYNLDKAQEEAIKLRQRVESGKVSSYSEAEGLIEEETKVFQEIKEVVKTGKFDPESIYQKNVPREQMNVFLLDLWANGNFSADNSQKFLKYLQDHTEEFSGISNIQAEQIPYGLDRLLVDTVVSKKSIAEFITLVERVFELNEDQKKKLVFNMYSHDLGQSYNRSGSYGDSYSDNIIQALKSELPLSESEKIDLAKKCVKKHLETWERGFNQKDNDHFVFDPVKFDELFKQLDLSPSVIFEDPEIVEMGIPLLRSMLSSVGKLKIETLEKLHTLAPMFFGANFDSEIELVAKKYLSSSYDIEKADKIFNLFGYESNKVEGIIKLTLRELLPRGHYPKELISYLERLNLGKLFQDNELTDAALIGRKKSLEYLNKESFTEICNKFGFDKNWFNDPELIEIVKVAILGRDRFDRIESCRRIYDDFGHEKIIADDRIKQKIQESIISNNYFGWKNKLEVFSAWQISTELLTAQAKQFILSKLDQTDRFDRYGLEEVSHVFPEILDLPDGLDPKICIPTLYD